MSYLGNSPGVASQRNTTTITATAGQTTFTTTSGYQLGYIDVFLNGTKLVSGDDFAASNGTSITLVSGANVGDSVELVSYTPRGLSDGYTKPEADAKFLIDNTSSINNLLDVDTATTAPTNGQALVWNTSSSRWLPGTILGGVTSITGTANQITASAGTGAITLSLPQDIATASSPTFTNLILSGELRGPSTLIIDPAAVGDDTGTVRIRGNLQVDGTTTTVNSTTLEVADLNITLAKNAINAASATGAGITIGNYANNPTILYTSSTDSWSINRDISVTGNLGLGVTPSAWAGISGKVFEFGYSGGNASLFQNGVNDTHFSSNAFYNGSAWTYSKTGTATRFYQGNSGEFQFHNASSGTAGNPITFTERMRITSAGNVGIGTTIPGTYLEVASPSGSGSAQINIHSPGGGGIITKLISERSGPFRISAEGGSGSGITFETGNSVTPVERMRIDPSGNVGIGTTPSYKLHVNGVTYADNFRVPNTTGFFYDIAGQNGIYIYGTTHGSIPNTLSLNTNGTERMRINSSGHTLPGTDNSYDLGSFTARWRNIYTADMHFSNEGGQNSIDGTWGNWTLQEGLDNIYMLNNRTGRRYKIALEEV